VFAPGAGRPLLGGGILLAAVALLWAFRLFPFSLPLLLVYLVAAGVLGFLASFFRDPERPVGDGIVSAADGRVREVVEEGELLRVSVFMNVTDVHVNRTPLDGTFAAVETTGAGHRPAYRADAGRNVSRTYELATALGPVRIVQVTGILARRLVSFVVPGDHRARGERFGMIVLGSRVDVLLPRARVDAAVHVGDRVWAGVTPIARERP
jgi:phosphatidylserine decarboxylase